MDHPKFGRRKLHIGGLIGMLISTLLLTAALTLDGKAENLHSSKSILADISAYGSIAFVILFVISFATGPGKCCTLMTFLTDNFHRSIFIFLGSIPWFFVSEVFPSNARGKADSIAVAFNWASIVAISVSFLPLYVSFSPRLNSEHDV